MERLLSRLPFSVCRYVFLLCIFIELDLFNKFTSWVGGFATPRSVVLIAATSFFSSR